MSDRPAPGEPRDGKNTAEGAAVADAERSFLNVKRIERGAAAGLAIGTLALTATFGLRTAVFNPDYSLAGEELFALGLHGAAELCAASLFGWIAVSIRREGAAKGALAAGAILICLVKVFVFGIHMTLPEPPQASLSPGTLLLCGVATLPLWLSFFPVLSAIHAARRARSLDAALGVRAAVSAWLGAVGLVSLVLGPDIAVRVWSLIALGAAALQVIRGTAELRRLVGWARGAITQGAPVYDVQEGAVPDEVPSVFEGDERVAVIRAAGQDSASYRREPSRRAVAAVDPTMALEPREFRARLNRRAGISLLVSALVVALCWPFLHGSDLPPRRLARMFDHRKISRTEEQEISSVVLWTVHMGAGANVTVGFDPDRNEVVEGQELLRRARGVPVPKLAKLANEVLFTGYCCVLVGSGADWPRDDQGQMPKEPHVKDGKLVFWRSLRGQVRRFEVAIEPEMVSDEGY